MSVCCVMQYLLTYVVLKIASINICDIMLPVYDVFFKTFME